MKKISTWARRHRYQSRVYIIAIKIVLLIMAVFTGKTLSGIGVSLSLQIASLAGSILLIAAWLYPNKTGSNYSKRSNYVSRKSLDFTIGFSTFILICTLANTDAVFIQTTSSSTVLAASVHGTTPTAEEILASLQYRDKHSLKRQEKRILRKELGKQITVLAIAKAGHDKEKSEKAVVVILTIIGAIGLTALLAALACSISCGGADGLAIVVFVIGLAAIIWGTIALLKGISRRYRKKKNGVPAVSPTS